MRQLLMSVLMIVTVVLIYVQIAQGNGGTKAQISISGSRMADHISRMNP